MQQTNGTPIPIVSGTVRDAILIEDSVYGELLSVVINVESVIGSRLPDGRTATYSVQMPPDADVEVGKQLILFGLATDWKYYNPRYEREE